MDNTVAICKNSASEMNEFKFMMLCEEGNMEAAKMLLQNKPTIDICADNNFAFRVSCENGYLEIAKWLLVIEPEIINTDLNYEFCRSCDNGHLDMAKWLLELFPKIDIRFNDDYTFTASCNSGH